jgi:opacity protein-like surface antigen
MKHFLLLAVMLLLALGTPAVPTATPTARVLAMSANPVEIEGVEFKGQKALLKAGYEFQRESRSSVVVLKTSNVARIQTGILTCTGPKRGCRADIYGERAACSNNCYFVGTRGGVKAQ